MKAVAYLRVSTEDQSLDRQHDDIEKFASEKGLKLVKKFEDTISGSKTNTDDRIGFNEMESYIELNNEIKHILVLEISRLGRKNNDIQNVVEKYIEKGINIHINDLNISTLDKYGKRSFASEMMISMLGVMAANETRLLSSRISSGKLSRARKNLAFGGKIIGYKKGKDGTPVINEDEAPMIKKIFELVSKDLGMRNTSVIIESEFGKKIAIGTLSGIIRNTFHKGERKYNELILKVPAIVSKEMWQKANDSIDSRTKFKSRTKVHSNIIQGKITCGECGSIMHQKVITNGRMNLFVCKNEECKNSINRPWLFRMIRLVVERHAQKTKDIQVRENYKLQILSHKSKIDINNKELEKLNKRRIKAREQYLDDDDFLKDDYNSIIDNIKQNIYIINKDNTKLNEFIRSSENALKSTIEHFSKDLELFKFEIKDIISHVKIQKESVLINIFGWREYELNKPNSTILGWQKRQLEKGIPVIEELPLRHPIKEEDLDIMIDNYLSE